MKCFAAILFLTFHLASRGQQIETYYDYSWKPCRANYATYYSTMQKTDSGWLRDDYFLGARTLQMHSLFADKDCKDENGFCQYYHANGIPSFIGRKIHGKQEGVCVRYYSNGMMSDSALFHDGKVVDKRIQWYRSGYMSDSITRVNDSTEIEIGLFDDGSLASAGYLVNGKQEARWKYYHHNGQISSSEVYKSGKLISADYFDESGRIQTDTSAVNRMATFQGGDQGWRKYLERNLYTPANKEFAHAGAATIGLDFVVDENGEIQDVEVSVPFHPDFDAIALKIVKSSPAWIPAVEHNRKVIAYRRQPITFQAD